jgi:signal transduction histidine kinase/ActR/RegA family two-component response regulator
MVIESNTDGSAKRIIGQHHDIDSSKRLDLAIRTALELHSGGSQGETLYELCKALAQATNAAFAGVAVPTHKEGTHTALLLAASSNGKPVIPFEYELEGTPCENTLSNDFCFVEYDVSSAYPDDKLLDSMNAQGYAGLRLTNSSGECIGIIMVIHDSPLRSPIDPQTALKLFGARASVELEHRLYAEHLKEALKLAESSNQAKSDFIANMSHEIRTPMTAILGYTEILEEHQSSSKSDACSSALQTIRKNGEHLLTILNDILDISKIEAGKMRADLIDVNPLEVLSTTEQLLSERAKGKGLEFQIELASKVPSRISTDPTRLRQILLNLIGNAIKFTECGHITLRCCYLKDDNRLMFEVIDTGIGMTEDQCNIIFDAFTQADTSTTREFGGSGLGLRISSTLAKMLGGTIQVESELGVGSRFWFTIEPGDTNDVAMVGIEEYHALTSSDEQTKRTNHSKQDSMLSGYRILLVEDGPDNQTLILHHLQRAGAMVDIAENGKICLDMLSASSPYDLVLMDMQMPVLDGYEATRQIRARGLRLPIIALTAHAMSSDREKCLTVGCNDYHAKPIQKAQLIELCSKLIQQHQNRSDQDHLAA